MPLLSDSLKYRGASSYLWLCSLMFYLTEEQNNFPPWKWNGPGLEIDDDDFFLLLCILLYFFRSSKIRFVAHTSPRWINNSSCVLLTLVRPLACLLDHQQQQQWTEFERWFCTTPRLWYRLMKLCLTCDSVPKLTYDIADYTIYFFHFYLPLV